MAESSQKDFDDTAGRFGILLAESFRDSVRPIGKAHRNQGDLVNAKYRLSSTVNAVLFLPHVSMLVVLFLMSFLNPFFTVGLGPAESLPPLIGGERVSLERFGQYPDGEVLLSSGECGEWTESELSEAGSDLVEPKGLSSGDGESCNMRGKNPSSPVSLGTCRGGETG